MAVYGCWFIPVNVTHYPQRHFLPQVELKAHTTIHATASRTKLEQTFQNDTSDKTPEVRYTFPLYDGVSVVSFKCTIGDKVILGVVKEKNQAQTEYKAAVARGESAALLEQDYDASDVFSTKIGNIPKGEKAVVEIEYVGELKHDAQLDGTRFMIPTSIAPRYGARSSDSVSSAASVTGGRIEITVDVEVDEGAQIEGVSSPSHPIALTLGRTTTQKDSFKGNRASATLSLGSSDLGKDFIVIVNAQNHAVPTALLEEHPDIPHHRALMTTLVPKFNLPNIHPEIVFVVDRSGSMDGKIPTLVAALKVFLKSLPLSAKFNICSFGSNHTFLFNKSLSYDEKSLQKALNDVDGFDSNYGGTEMLEPIKEVVKRRLKGIPLEIMVLTDGEIWNQQEAFDFVNHAAKEDVRLFSLGIGTGVSTALVEGLARAGNGFAQFVQDTERMDKVVVRMLKAALSPHITDYRLEVKYDVAEDKSASDDGFELIESTTTLVAPSDINQPQKSDSKPAPISLFDANFKEDAPNPPAGRYDHLPNIDLPQTLQAPEKIRGLFPYNRVSAFVLLPDSTQKIKSVTLQGTYNNAPVQLQIPVQNIGPGKTIHQLAAKKAMLETEEGRGWLSTVTGSDGKLLKSKHEADWDRITEKEAVRLGVTFQVAGKFCSFVAVERGSKEGDSVVDVVEPQRQQTLAPAQFYSSALPPAPAAMFSAPSTSSFRSRSSFGGKPPPPGGVPQPKSASLFGNSRSVSKSSAPPGGSTVSRIGGLFGGMTTAASSRSSAPAKPAATFGSNQAAVPQSLDQSSSFSFGASPEPDGVDTGFALFADAGDTEDTEQESFADESEQSKSEKRLESGTDMKKKKEKRSLFGSSGGTFLRKGFGSAPPPAPPPAAAEAPSAPVSVPQTTEAKIHAIIGLQRFDGSWLANDALFKLTEVWKADFDDATLKYGDETVKATILAIAWLEKMAARDMEVWEMVVDKAKQWLADKHGINDPDDVVGRAVAVFFP